MNTLVATEQQDSLPEQNRITVARFAKIGAEIGAKRYLEIGVFKGQTFLNLDFAEMHGVDPAFQFNARAAATDQRHFFRKSSDAFFANLPDNKPYDLIFLDGLHTFEQTFRDFCAVQALSHAGTVLVIDDTVPTDIFSMMPDMEAAFSLRDEHGLHGRHWHGDVCKVLFAIHDFFPTLDYRTVTDTGNAQTIVIRRPRRDFKPRWNSLEAISRLDYAGFLANADLLNELPEQDVADWIAGR